MERASPLSIGRSERPTSTARGLVWLILSLGLALAGNLALIGALAYQRAQGPDFVLALATTTVWEVLLAVSATAAIFGYRGLRHGRFELDSAHTGAMRQSSLAFVGSSASAGALLLTGIVLAVVYVPSGAYVGSAGTPAPWSIWIGDGLRGTHQLAPLLLAVFLAVFLLRALWNLSGSAGRVAASAAFTAGLFAALLGALSALTTVLPPWTADPVLAGAFGTASLALWTVVCILARMRLRVAYPAAPRNTALS